MLVFVVPTCPHHTINFAEFCGCGEFFFRVSFPKNYGERLKGSPSGITGTGGGNGFSGEEGGCGLTDFSEIRESTYFLVGGPLGGYPKGMRVPGGITGTGGGNGFSEEEDGCGLTDFSEIRESTYFLVGGCWRVRRFPCGITGTEEGDGFSEGADGGGFVDFSCSDMPPSYHKFRRISRWRRKIFPVLFWKTPAHT